MVKVKPVNDSILIELEEDEWQAPNPEIVRILKSGMFEIPSQYKGWYQKRSRTGKVLDVGQDVKQIRAGDRIFFQLPSLPISDEEPKLRLILEQQVLAWLE